MPAGLTSVQVAFNYCNKHWVLVEASVVKCVMTQVVNSINISAALQQHLHCILTAILTAQNERCPEETKKEIMGSHSPKSSYEMILLVKERLLNQRIGKNNSLCILLKTEMFCSSEESTQLTKTGECKKRSEKVFKTSINNVCQTQLKLFIFVNKVDIANAMMPMGELLTDTPVLVLIGWVMHYFWGCIK